MTVMERLMAFSPTGKMEDWEYPMIQGEIDKLNSQGWTDNEIISKLRWTEHVNPDVEEDVALRNMKAADERVLVRKRIQYAVDQTTQPAA